MQQTISKSASPPPLLAIAIQEKFPLTVFQSLGSMSSLSPIDLSGGFVQLGGGASSCPQILANSMLVSSKSTGIVVAT